MCTWSQLRSDPEDPVHDYVEDFRPTASPYPLQQQFTESQLISEMRNGSMIGLIQADFSIPQHQRIGFE